MYTVPSPINKIQVRNEPQKLTGASRKEPRNVYRISQQELQHKIMQLSESTDPSGGFIVIQNTYIVSSLLVSTQSRHRKARSDHTWLL